MPKFNSLLWLLAGSISNFAIALMISPLVVNAIEEAKYKLEVLSVTGSVDYRVGGSLTRPVNMGDILHKVGDRIITHSQSTAVLQLNKTIAQVTLLADTELVIRNFQIARNGGLISLLAVNSGQARFQVPAFKNPSSILQVSTPAGVVTVKNGANYNLMVAPNGRTTVVSLSGTLTVTANNRSIQVPKDFYTYISPGTSPAPPKKLGSF